MRKIKALARIAPFLNNRKRKVLLNAFFKSQFSFFPLSWIFHSRTLNNKINRLHERCLCIIYNDNTSSFTDLLEIDNLVSVHHRNIQVLSTELNKFVNSLSPKLVSNCFKLNNMTVYNTRNRSTFYSRPVRTVLHGTESLSHLGLKIWEHVPNDMKNLIAFKKVIKQCKPHACISHMAMYICVHMCMCVYLCVYTYMYICVYVYIYIYICIYICVNSATGRP